MKGLVYHLLHSKIRKFTKLQGEMENVSFNFSEPQGLVLKESLGNALLLEGAWGAVLCSVNIFWGDGPSPRAAPGGTKAPVAKQPVLGRGRPRVALGSWAPRANAARGRSGAGCWCRRNRFGWWFHPGKDGVGRGSFLCDKSLLVSTAGKLNYQ